MTSRRETLTIEFTPPDSGRVAERESASGQSLGREERLRVAAWLWRDLGAVKEDRVRVEFFRRVGLQDLLTPASSL